MPTDKAMQDIVVRHREAATGLWQPGIFQWRTKTATVGRNWPPPQPVAQMLGRALFDVPNVAEPERGPTPQTWRGGRLAERLR